VGIFKREKQKKRNKLVTLPCARQEGARQSDHSCPPWHLCRASKGAHGNSAILCRAPSRRRTAMVPFFAVRLAEDARQCSNLCRAPSRRRTAKFNTLPCVMDTRRTANRATCRSLTPLPFARGFFCRESTLTHGKDIRRARDKKHTAKPLCRANCCRAGFAVRRDGKRTAKRLPCVYWRLPCAAGARQRGALP
jgi:hypothetical protein